MRARSLLDSFNYAFTGILYAFKTQRNIRIHFLITTLVLILSLVFKLSKLEILILLVTIAFVIMAEMINTAIEETINLITQDYHPLAGAAKNVAAGAVLVASTVAIVVGYLIFFPKVDPLLPRVIQAIKSTPAYLSLVALLITVVAVIAIKAITKHGTPMQGGMPSGHSALAAVASTSIVFLAPKSLVIVLALFLFILVAESRVENKIHSIPEVFIGGTLGFFLTLLVFQLTRW